MAENNKTYWKGLEELHNEVEFVKNAQSEFGAMPTAQETESNGPHRRDFLKALGFSVAAVSLAACDAPVKKAIPMLAKPEEYDPSIANYYASSYVEGGDYCAVLVKTREGRPIKIEGNTLSSITRGGTHARVQASVLSLYDTERYLGPKSNKKNTTWEALDAELSSQLAKVSSAGIRVVSNTIISPTAKLALNEFLAKYSGAKHVVYDANSASGLLKANADSFGVRAIPSYHFDKAQVVVSFGADFLGTWISPVEYAKQWSAGRKLGKDKQDMSRLYVLESNMSLTGSNADYRTPVRASEEGLFVAALYNAVASAKGGSTVAVSAPTDAKAIDKIANDSLANAGSSIVVSGSNDANVQTLVNGINNILGNYGKTIDLSTPSYARQGDDAAMSAFVSELNSGAVSAVIYWNCNPAYDHPQAAAIAEGTKKVAVSISTSDRPDETSALVNYIAPTTHYLESWGDVEPKKGYYSLIQPAISKIFKSRQAEETLLKLAGNNTDYYTYLQNSWKANVFPIQSNYSSFRDFWNYTLHDGVFEPAVSAIRTFETQTVKTDSTSESVNVGVLGKGASATNRVQPVVANQPSFIGNASNAGSGISSTYKANASGVDVVFAESIALGTGVQANNPWLQELPDPVTRACWDNYISIPSSFAKEKNIKMIEGKTVLLELKANGKSIKLPAMVQPGQAKGTVSIFMGYGRSVTGLAGKVGKDVYSWIQNVNGGLQYFVGNATLEVTSEAYHIAHVQTHHTVMGRDIIQEAKLTEYQKNNAAGRSIVMVETPEGPKPASDISIWNMHSRPNHSWGMMIDMNSCIGCGNCVIACNAENNIPVVGKQEVLNRREMHWMRIDRYYSSQGKDEYDYANHELPEDNPEVVYQPLMCQHCNNAPCETVCPVVATTHSTEGLNQMTYNRCIGTRYCANNCPYKVRRFNWFSYPQNPERFPLNFATTSDLGRMVLNPDVTVRARGVMEKCSMCVQRIQEGKLHAKKENRRPIDGEIVTACQQSCPTDAIMFGDMNDTSSQISTLIANEYDKRAYHVLDEINVRPSVSYLTKIRNKA